MGARRPLEGEPRARLADPGHADGPEAPRGPRRLGQAQREADPVALAASIAASREAPRPSRGAALGRPGLPSALGKARPDSLQGHRRRHRGPREGGALARQPDRRRRDRADDLALALAVASSGRRVRAAVAEYAACPRRAIPAPDAYERSGRILNLLIKDNLLKRAAREAELIAFGRSSTTAHAKDDSSEPSRKDGTELDYYLNGQYAGLYDSRNFPPFPAGDEYLGEQYFAMGDNRYNSLDFRYKTGEFSVKPLDPADPASVQYYSNIEPFALDLRFIEGYALFRIWPPGRTGAIR